MRPSFLQTICSVALLFAAAFNLPAQSSPVPPDVKAFAAQYVAAFNSKDLARFKSMQIPQSLACITPENKDVYDWLLAAQMRDSVSPNYRLSLMQVSDQNLKALASEEYFPVKPEHELHIDYEYPGTQDGGTILTWIVRQNGRWMADFPCMTSKAIEDFRADAADREQYKKLAATIKEPLRSELLAMLRVHKTGEAETRYQQASGTDMRTSVLVINALQDQLASANQSR
ncbi:MAG: hypothetical protein WBP85_04200 [Terracidiphilus sp.]